MCVGLELTIHGLQEQFITTDEMRLLEIKLKLLSGVQVVQNDEAIGWFIVGNISEVDTFS